VLRTVLQVALIVASIYVPGALGLAGIEAALASTAILVGGNLAINALIPPPVPAAAAALAGGADNRGQERLVASSVNNRLRPYGRRTLVLGSMRIAPDLLTRQLLAPSAPRVLVPGASTASLGLRLDRNMVLDLGIGDLRLGTVSVAAGAQSSPTEKIVVADSEPVAPQYLVGPAGALAPPSGRGIIAEWPMRARAVADKAEVLSGQTVKVDRTRTASRLVCLIGGLLYGSTAAGALQNKSTTVKFLGEEPDKTDIDETVTISNAALSPEYVAVELAGGRRDWSLTGGARSVSTRQRVELSLVGSYWLAPLSDLSDRRLPTTLCGVRLNGVVGAPPSRTLRMEIDQAVPVPNAAGVWSTSRSKSRNPAAVLRAFARGWYDTEKRTGGPKPTGLLLAGTGRDPETIDDAVLARFYRRCENHDPKLRCDLALQGDERPAEEIERLIAATGRADISWATGKLGVVWAEPDDEPQGLISPAQVLPGSLSIAWRDGPAPDEIVASYLDRTKWEGAEVRIAVPNAAGGGRERQVRLEGVTELGPARFHTASIAAEEAYHRRALSWRAGREGALMTRGSLWLMAADLISGGVTGRLREFGEAQVRLDRPVRLSGQAWLAIDAPGAALHRTPVIAAGPDGGDTDTLTLALPHPEVSAGISPRDVVWRFYNLALPPRPVRILSNVPRSETEFEIAARDEIRDYWTFLDDYRAVPATPDETVNLPSRVRKRVSGSWSWPQAWTDAGIVEASLVVVGAAGGDGGLSRIVTTTTTYGPDKDGNYQTVTKTRHYRGGAGGDGGTTTVTIGGTPYVLAGSAGGSKGPGGNVAYNYRFKAKPPITRVWTITRASAPIVFVLGRGGSGGEDGYYDTSAPRGANAYAEIIPLPP